jgi:uncharacterized protein (DUF1778 family)
MATATATIHLRTAPETKTLLSLAVEMSGAASLTDYILRAAVARAQADISNQQTFAMKSGPWSEFAKRLDAPAKDLPQLRKILTTSDLFDRAAKST